MDSYKKPKLEYKGIKDVIDQYSLDGNIGNYTEGLKQGLETDEIENVF